jgi:hypothetical protein
MQNHPKDRHVLAGAVVARAEIIVTDNLKDFPEKVITPLGLEVQKTDNFLLHQFDLDRELFLQYLRKVASKRAKPPLSFEEL